MVSSSNNVTISGLIVDGGGLNALTATGGIVYDHSAGTISKNVVRDVRRTGAPTDPYGFGIYLYIPSARVTVTQNSIINSQRAGIAALGGTLAPVVVSKNRIFASGKNGSNPVGVWLQIGSNASSVTANKISADWNPDTGYPSRGIVIESTSYTKVTGNLINNVQWGIHVIDTSCTTDFDASYNTVTKNTLTDTDDGIGVVSDATLCVSGATNADHNIIKSNKVYKNVAGGGAIAVFVIGSGIAEGNTIKGNLLYGRWGLFIVQSGDTGTIGVSPTNTNKTGDILKPGT